MLPTVPDRMRSHRQTRYVDEYLIWILEKYSSVKACNQTTLQGPGTFSELHLIYNSNFSASSTIHTHKDIPSTIQPMDSIENKKYYSKKCVRLTRTVLGTSQPIVREHRGREGRRDRREILPLREDDERTDDQEISIPAMNERYLTCEIQASRFVLGRWKSLDTNNFGRKID